MRAGGLQLEAAGRMFVVGRRAAGTLAEGRGILSAGKEENIVSKPAQGEKQQLTLQFSHAGEEAVSKIYHSVEASGNK